jgi:uncharacterized protein YdiU (UPF0061 family)
MSIVGVTIDYGPYGFLDKYDPGHICNGSDDGGRYAYGQQPRVCRWNLGKLAEVLSSCLSEEAAQDGLRVYDTEFEKSYLAKMRLKLGLLNKHEEEDGDLMESLLDTMHVTGCDFTNGFHCFSQVTIPDSTENIERGLEEVVQCLLEECASPQQLIQSFKPKMPPHQLHMFLQLMQQAPEVLQALGMSADSLKQEIIKMEEADKLKSMSVDDKCSADRAAWLKWLSRYSHRLYREIEPGTAADQANKERLATMQQNNPRFILRNHILQTAIEQAEKGDFSEVHKLLELLQTPYALPSSLQPTTTRSDESTDSAVAAVQVTQAESRHVAVEGSSESSQRKEEGDGLEESVANMSVAASEGGDVSRYYSRPPDWALSLCVT